MDKTEIERRIRTGRNFLKPEDERDTEGYETDQEKKLPQPPLTKAPMTNRSIPLPLDFEKLPLKDNLRELLLKRKSSRVYTQEPMSLLELSFLLWATQGIKEIRGKSYATIRTAPAGGARHPFETYLLLKDIEGLEPGAYHYLPMTHRLELLRSMEREELASLMGTSLSDQHWADKSNAVFYWSLVPYRNEWRYGIYAHRLIMADMGHVGENLYLACAALGLGTCGIGAYDGALCDKLFSLDGEEEFIVYCETVGTIRPEDSKEEKDFYRFVEEQGL